MVVLCGEVGGERTIGLDLLGSILKDSFHVALKWNLRESRKKRQKLK